MCKRYHCPNYYLQINTSNCNNHIVKGDHNLDCNSYCNCLYYQNYLTYANNNSNSNNSNCAFIQSNQMRNIDEYDADINCDSINVGRLLQNRRINLGSQSNCDRSGSVINDISLEKGGTTKNISKTNNNFDDSNVNSVALDLDVFQMCNGVKFNFIKYTRTVMNMNSLWDISMFCYRSLIHNNNNNLCYPLLNKRRHNNRNFSTTTSASISNAACNNNKFKSLFIVLIILFVFCINKAGGGKIYLNTLCKIIIIFS